MRLLHRLQLLDLSLHWELIEIYSEILDPLMICLAWIILPLIAMFRHGVDKRSLGVAIFVRAVGTCELPIDINHNSGFLRARPGGIAWEDSLASRRDYARFAGAEETQRNVYGSFLCLQPERFSSQRVQQRAAERAGWNS